MRTTLLILKLGLILFFAGCGYKGPLYLSKDKPPAAKKSSSRSSTPASAPAAAPAAPASDPAAVSGTAPSTPQ